MIRTRQTIKPGRKGTRKLLDKYGDRLVCVRYHYDYKQQERITTVELIEERAKWRPNRIASSTIVPIKVNWGEEEIARRIKKSGGKWNKTKKIWELSYGKAKDLHIESRIIQNT